MRIETLACLSVLLACHDGSTTTRGVPAETTQPEPTAAPELEHAQKVELPGLALVRGGHATSIVDVFLSPDASAALTLDGEGGVRLWPVLDGSREPVIIPIDDPNQLSLARTPTGFVLAMLDTIGGAEVYEVHERAGELSLRFASAQSPSPPEAKLSLEARFSIPPSDPQFELHVLDGGQRLLALGMDHRIRLLDAQGKELSSLAKHGFVPWQLRHVETPTGVALVAILAGPTRVQPLELRDDQLQIIGKPLRVDLDRGPNRNDLALTPDGKHIAAFSRRKWHRQGRRVPENSRRNGEWKLQLLAIADGQETLIEGKLDSEARPRVHLLDGARMLLDDGSGVGQLIALDPALPSTPTLRPLPGSTEDTHSFTSVERGVRIVPNGDHFLVDRLDGDEHVRLGHERLSMQSAGLSPDGTRVIWAFADGWAIEEIDGEPTPPTIRDPNQSPLLFADFVDDDRVVLVSEAGPIELVDVKNGWPIATRKAPRTLTEARLARGESPMLLVRDVGSARDLLFGLGPDGMTAEASVVIESEFVGPWYPAPTPGAWTSMAWGRGQTYVHAASEEALETELGLVLDYEYTNIYDVVTTAAGTRVFAVWMGANVLVRTRPSETTRVGELELVHTLEHADGVSYLVPSPNAELLAAVHSDRSVSIHDSVTLERKWTRVDADATSLGWSQSGARLVVAGLDGGAVLDATTGELLLERRDLGLHVERKKNPMPISDSLPGDQLPSQ
jgi:hypothetical protein